MSAEKPGNGKVAAEGPKPEDIPEGAQAEQRAVEAEQTDRSPEEIRAGIEQTREELGETVEALAAKTDVKAQAKAAADDAKADTKAKVDEAVSTAQATVEQNVPASQNEAVEDIKDNPVPVVAIAGGVVAGALVVVWLLRRRR